MSADNLALWSTVERTPVEHTKPITGKSYSGNSPKPQWLVRKATETFGPCGIGWGFTVVDERVEPGPGEERMHVARVRVWYEWNGKRGEVEHIGGTPFAGIRSSGKPFMDEDAPKKSITDALVKALSMIGFAGDIFLGRYDDSKYVNELRQEEREARQETQRREHARDEADDGQDDADSAVEGSRERYVKECQQRIANPQETPDSLRAWWDREKDVRRGIGLSQTDVDALKALLVARLNPERVAA